MTLTNPTFEEASRFLSQASFGPTPDAVAEVRDAGLEAWFLAQAEMAFRPMLPRYQRAADNNRHYVYPLFWEGAIHGEDQLRQRVAYALSRLVVVSLEEAEGWPDAFVTYADHLAEQAFGNYGALLRAVTYSPAMGLYLSHLGNEKADPETGSAPDENYARELMQLFTIGTVPLTPDGRALPGEAYTPDDVAGLAAIMTGLTWADQDRFHSNRLPKGHPKSLLPMDAYPVAHEQRPKRFLGYEAEGPNPITAIDGALAHLMAHPNTAPFVSRRLIQSLVTSNPAPEYVGRVAEAFRTGRYALPSGREIGDGEPGAMVPVIAAILFDAHARSPERLTDPAFGRVREPTMRFAHAFRAFHAPFDMTLPPQNAGRVTYSHHQAEFAEQPWYAPSVFGAFGPDYRASGTAAAQADLASPEMQAQNAASVVGYLNHVSDLTKNGGRGALTADFTDLDDAVEAGPSETADLLSRRFYHGAMPEPSRAKLIRALDSLRTPNGNAIQDANRPAVQKQFALSWAMTDPAFVVQR